MAVTDDGGVHKCETVRWDVVREGGGMAKVDATRHTRGP